MNELSTHIEYLLLNHDCVVVPQFGAFMTQQASAARSEEEQLFFPPLRRVRFNAGVTADDGLLVASVCACHDVDEPQAKRIIQTMVLNLRQQLLADGQVDFGSIGLFTQDEDGMVEFSACQAGAVSPDFYGLDVFQLPKVEINNKGSRANKHRLLLSRDESESHITIHINRRLLRHALTTAAAVMLCLLCTVPLRDSSNGGVREATLTTPLTTPHAVKPVSAPTPAPKVTPQSSTQVSSSELQTPTSPAVEPIAHPAGGNSVADTANVAPQPATAAEQTVQTAVKAEAPAPEAEAPMAEPAQQPKAIAPGEGAPVAYAIVLASNTSEVNARDFVARLQKMGYANARIYNNGRLMRVILDGYKTEEEALDAKHKLQWTHDGFDDAWLLRP